MITYALRRSGAQYISMPGDTLYHAIETAQHSLLKEADIGTAAGYYLLSVRALLPRCEDNDMQRYEIPVEITGQGMPLVGSYATPPVTRRVYVIADHGCPSPDEIAACVWQVQPEVTPANPRRYYDLLHPLHPDYTPYPR
jgi:hypothetical protein